MGIQVNAQLEDSKYIVAVQRYIEKSKWSNIEMNQTLISK